MEDSSPDVEISYETLWKAIIRPPRDSYLEADLVDEVFTFNQKTYFRKDYDLINKDGLILKCSMIEPEESFERQPLVIYLHGNSSSRIEGLEMAPYLIKNNINIFVFDFAGSGHSEGEYISLGYKEQEDVNVVVDFVKKLPNVSKIGLWGRSMGAATALMYAFRDKRISCMFIDSSFMEFKLLAQQLCKNYKNIPSVIVNFAFYFIKKTIFNKINVDIEKINPIENVDKINIPAFFIHAINDELIPLEHTLKIYEKYKGEKELNIVEEGHNSQRKRHIIDKVIQFFIKHLIETNEEEKN